LAGEKSPAIFLKENIMLARNRYVVVYGKKYIMNNPGCDEVKEVYADRILLTPNGDAVFSQVRDSVLVNEQGNGRFIGRDMATVLVVGAGVFEEIRLVPAGTERPAYTESGAVELTH
jgi:hypothetical protein